MSIRINTLGTIVFSKAVIFFGPLAGPAGLKYLIAATITNNEADSPKMNSVRMNQDPNLVTEVSRPG